jgi:hypothetical protein
LGIQYPNITTPFLLDGLAVNKAYDVYIRSVCGAAGESEWIGPVTFTTLLVGTLNPETNPPVSIFPNPANSQFFVLADQLESLRCLNLNGQELPVQQRQLDAQTIQVMTKLTPGLYMLEIRAARGKTIEKIWIGE